MEQQQVQRDMEAHIEELIKPTTWPHWLKGTKKNGTCVSLNLDQVLMWLMLMGLINNNIASNNQIESIIYDCFSYADIVRGPAPAPASAPAPAPSLQVIPGPSQQPTKVIEPSKAVQYLVPEILAPAPVI